MANPKRQVFSRTAGDNTVTVIGNKAAFDTYVSGFTLDAAQGASNIQFSRSGFSAKQYPGDTSPISRGGATVERLKAPGIASGALPGKSFWLEQVVGTGEEAVKNVNQFTLVGRVMDMHAACVSGAQGNIVFRSPGGKGYPIADPTP